MAGMMGKIADEAQGTPGTQPPTRGQMQSNDAEPDARDPNEPQEGGEEGEDQPNVSPEEQAAYDEFVKNGYRLLYDEQGNVRPGIIELLQKSGGDQSGGPPAQGQPQGDAQDENKGPVAALANAAVTVVVQLVQSSKEAGAPTPDEVIAHGGMAIMEDLATIALGEKIHDYQPGEMDAAFVKATQLYYNVAKARGLLGDEENLKQEFAQIKDADAQGPEALDKVLPGIGQAVAANSGGEQAQPAPQDQGAM